MDQLYSSKEKLIKKTIEQKKTEKTKVNQTINQITSDFNTNLF